MAKQISIAAVVAICISLMTLTPQPVWGQAVYGSIIGTVTDPQGAAVANAKVTVTNQRKGTSDTTTTNADGNYSVTHLIPDVYTLRAEGAGFKASEIKDVSVSADASARVDMAFQVGGTSETVEVTAEAPQLKTDRADVALEFNQRQVEGIPNIGRNFTNLQLMAPGSQKMGWAHAATENPQQGQQIVTQGQHFSGTAFELDGTDNQDPILGIIVVNPNLDAVTEAKVALQNYDAEFGKAVGSVVTAQTKSGSNDIHGSGFYIRNTDALKARDPFTQDPGAPFPHARYQQFGGTLGGAIIKNKLFYFGDYQGTRQTKGLSGRFTMPTQTARDTCTGPNGPNPDTTFCDLSDYLGAVTTGGGQVYDPATGDATGAGRTPFNGNLIPNNRLSPAAVNILQALPVPQSDSVTNNFVGSGSGPLTQNSFDTRIDYAATSTISVFGRFSLDYFKLSGKGLLGQMQGPGDGGGDSAPGLAGSSIVHNYSLSVGVTKTISSSLLTDVRFGWFKYNPVTQKPDGGTPMTDFGIPGANTDDPKTGGLGYFALAGSPGSLSGAGCAPNNGGAGCVVSSFGDGLGVARCNCPLTESEQQVQFVNNWTKTKGNHLFKFGADIRYALNLRIPSDNNRTGEFNFSPQATAQGGNGGLDLATFLLGEVTSFARYVNNPTVAPPAERQKRMFFYAQDTWRITPKLTLNYGLRWEIYFPETVNAKGGGGFANITDFGGQGAIRVAGFGGIGSNGNVDNDWKAFAPRLGVAYQITPKTVIRMGYGRSYDIGVFGSNFGHTVTQNLPVLLKQNFNASNFAGPANGCGIPVGASGDKIPLFSLDLGPSSCPPIDPANAFPDIPSNGVIPFSSLGGAISGVHIRPPSQVLPRVDAYNATVQRQITNSISLEVAYVGSKGTHGFAGDGPNYDVNPKSMALYGVIDPLTGSPYADNLRRPLCRPNLATDTCTGIAFDLGNYYGNDAASTYNAFEVKVEKRFTQGLQFISHYTYSHSSSYDSNYYAIDHAIAWGPTNWNRNHVWVFSPVYELPFGKGKKYMGDAGRAADYLVGGWQLSSNTTWSSGLPWTAGFSKCGGEQDVGVCRPDRGTGSFHTGVSGHIDPAHHNLTFYTPVPDITNPANPPGPFADPTKGHLGNIGRNSFWGPRAFTSDLSIVKKFPIYERFNMQFRTDVFNLFNHAVYANPNTTIDGTGQNDGKITGLQFGSPMRQIQFALRFDF